MTGARPVKICAARGCNDPTAAPHLSKCAPCLLGTKRIEKMIAQHRAVEALPAIVVPAGAWAFRVPGLPVSANNSLIRMGHRTFLDPKAREWKRSISIIAAQTRPSGWPLTGRYEVEITSVFANPSADADGPIKLVLDALKLTAWRDDRQVAQVLAKKLVDRDAPRIEVVVRVSA